MAAVTDQLASGEPFVESACVVGDHRVVADRKFLFVDQFLHGADRFIIGARIVDLC